LASASRFFALLALFGLVVLGVFAFSFGQPRVDRTITLPPSTSNPWHKRFFVGAWCSPPTSTVDPEVWRTFSQTGIAVAFRPLEDPNDRRLNQATLALLDSLRSTASELRILVRDDAVHPDEATRAGWRDRVHQVALAYDGHRSLAGIFLADEPKPSEFDRVADVAAAFAEEGLLAYVNLRPLSAYANVSEQERWRADATRLIRRGRLPMFSFASYSQTRDGEDATFLLTLANAQQVANETGTRFAAVLQFTGFDPLDPLPRAQLDYLAAEAVAHGAIGIIWFTYWTPNPQEEGMWWKGGAVEYDGRPSDRAELMRAVSMRARTLANQFEGTHVAHFGGDWPRGGLLVNARIPGMRAVRGGPCTVASWGSYPAALLVINRDRASPRTFELDLEPRVGAVTIDRVDGSGAHGPFDSRTVRVRLEPGGSAILNFGAR
jgi:hypothetical protein